MFGIQSVLWVAGVVALLICLRWLVQWSRSPLKTKFLEIPSASTCDGTLCVMVHGLTGLKAFQGAIDLARSALPCADVLAVDYDCRLFSNTDPSVVADVLEREIHRLLAERQYRSIVLVGHSAGGAILRKAFVWAHGMEEDRGRFGRQGKRVWVNRVGRIVLLAGINRGYSIEPRPEAMSFPTYLGIWGALRVARLLGIGKSVLGFYRGEPFVADTRLQWLRVARSDEIVNGVQPFPVVVHLLGSEDDIVSREDSQDLVASRGTLFKTLPQTNHRDIAASLDQTASGEFSFRSKAIRSAIAGDIDSLEPDKQELPPENRLVTRLFYVMHGIRDYGFWTDTVRGAIESRCQRAGEVVKVVNHKYGYFPMLPFILYRDRQRNVRRFMDDYTENVASYPNAKFMDYIGHSNGTYILASALINYETIKVRRVFFAGSVVPKHFPWSRLIQNRRVEGVVNVVATRDWVVALFPKLFEQIADWVGARPTRGWLDIGAAGFRGFIDSGSASGQVRDLNFAIGAHSTGVEVADSAKLEAIVAYAVDGDLSKLTPFMVARKQDVCLDVLSNVSYLVWVGLVLLVITAGWLVTAAAGWPGLVGYTALIFAILHSI